MNKFNNNFIEIVLYIINRIYDKEINKVKLHMILWFSDLEKYVKSGLTITNSSYVRKEFGPMSCNLNKALNDLINCGAITSFKKNNESQWIYKPIKNADISFLSEEDKEIINNQINRIKSMTAKQISDESHTSTWKALKNGDEISVAFVAIEQLVNNNIDDIDWD